MVTIQAIINVVNNMSIQDAGREVVQPISWTPEAPIQEEYVDAELENLQQPEDEVQEIRPVETSEPTEEQSAGTNIIDNLMYEGVRDLLKGYHLRN